MTHDLITVEKFQTQYAKEFELQLVSGAQGLNRPIHEPTINRPGLILAGFNRFFASKRMQVIGSAEATFLKSLPAEVRAERYHTLCAHHIPGIVFCRRINPDKLLLQASERAHVPIFKCPFITMKFINLATLALETMFAPHGTDMGSMVDILGVGVIIRGESGIGKSECVLELIERGYSLVSDDITNVMLVGGHEVIGSSPALIRNQMEVRGIGIIDVAAMFGVKCIRSEKQVDLVVTLKGWNEVADVDRLGLEQEYVKILGMDIPHITIPVRPGRNLARLVEVAAFQTKLRTAGFNPAKALDNRIIAQMSTVPPPKSSS